MLPNNLNGNLEGLLEQMGIEDPASRQRLQLLAQLMENNQADSLEESEEKERIRQQRQQRARQKLRRLQREHEILLDRNEELAAALGACPACWGENRACQICRGRGKPGYLPPEEEAFSEYVMPALDRLGVFKTGETSQTEKEQENEP